jgi:predicted DNA-binding transcriptional regulator YafY
MRLKTTKGSKMSKTDANTRKSIIYMKLATSQTIHTTSLAAEFEVSERTIQNDINDLKLAYDIVSDKKGYYRLKETPKPIDEEMKEIVKSLLCSLGLQTFPEFKNEITSILGNDREYFVFDTESEKIEKFDDFKILLQMLKWNYSVEIEYNNKKRTVHPFKIANLHNYWYLFALDLQTNKLKSFLINKITSMRPIFDNLLANETIQKEIKEELSQNISPWISNEQKSVELEIYAPLNDTIQRKLPINTELIEHKENYSIIKLFYYDDREAIRFISGYLPYIKVKDEKLNKQLKDNLLEALKMCEEN